PKCSLIESQPRIDDVHMIVVLELGRDMFGRNVHGRFPSPLQFLLAETDMLHPHLQVLLFFHHDHDSFPPHKAKKSFKPFKKFQPFKRLTSLRKSSKQPGNCALPLRLIDWHEKILDRYTVL